MSENWDEDKPVGVNYHMSVEEANLLDIYYNTLEGPQNRFKIWYRIHLTRQINRVRWASNQRTIHNNIWNEAK